ncbi:PIN domain-containing protein [Pedobacter sp. Leaf250]|uniref:PIN domain-containing protein n=1 Tax=Pedobacter sp. Leaf250 TaxID=2876559 RepID=UPI001E35566B|nr:PIN domain-containing protein [Pedobacter sp. Leaf250]
MKSTEPIRHFALDTSFIESQNFLAGRLLRNLGDMGKKGYVKIYITDIVYREVLSRFAKRLLEEENKIHSVKKTIESHIRVLKNFDDYAAYFTLPELDTNKLTGQFKEEFDKWISNADIKVLPTDGQTIEKVMKDYFQGNPPFGAAKKKSEFPDAFSFYALDQFFKLGKKQCYFVTHDTDFDEAVSQYIIPIKEIGEQLDVINRASELRFGILKKIEEVYTSSKSQLEHDAKIYFAEYLEEDANAKTEIMGMLIDHVESFGVTDFKFDRYNIVQTGDSGAQLQCEAIVPYTVTFILKDENRTPHLNKNDFGYIGVDYSPYVIKAEKAIDFYVSIDIDPKTGKANAKLSDAVSPTSIDIFDDWHYDFFFNQSKNH